MKKQAYQVHFHPVPVPTGEALYFDTVPTPLPYAENISTLHYHDMYEVGVCLEGEGLFLSEGAFSSVSRGDVIFISPDKRHYSRSLSEGAPCICRFVHPDANKIRALLLHLSESEEKTESILAATAERIPAILHPSEYPAQCALLSDLVFSCQASTEYVAQTVNLRLALFLLEVYRTFHPQPSHTSADPRTDQAVAAVAAYLAVHYDRNDTATELAQICYLSESQLRRRFLAVYGIPPVAYRNRLRTAVAKELLLHTALPISEVCARVGYGDVSDLYRAFTKHVGISPSAFRSSARTTADPPSSVT